MTITVSVIMAVHNGADHVEAALDSVLASTWTDIEVIVVDDGSTDGSLNVVRSFADRDDRIVIVALPLNVGVAQARSAGVRQSTGEFVWFVDADDKVSQGGLTQMVAAAERFSADVVIGGSAVVGGTSRAPTATARQWTGPSALRALLLGEIRGQLWDKLIAGRIVRGVEVPVSRVHSDVALASRCLAVATTVVRIDDIVYTYGVRSTSIIGSARRRAESLRIIERVVSEAATSTGSTQYDEIAYYRARFIGLSMIRDAAAGGYSDAESSALLIEGRKRIGWSAIRRSALRSEWRVSATLIAAALWPQAFVLARRWARVRR